MKKDLIIFSLGFNFLLMFVCGYLYFQASAATDMAASASFNKVPMSSERLFVKKYAVAIITPAAHQSLEEIQLGFEETLINKYKLNAVFSIFNGNGNRSLLRAQIEEVGRGHYDLVFTIGAIATQLTKEIFVKRGVKTPLVFGAVARPVKLGLVDVLDSPSNVLTGSAANTHYHLQIDSLLLVKPAAKNVLLIYDPSQSSGLEDDCHRIEQEFAAHGVQFSSCEVFNVREIQQKVPLIINKNIDVVMVLKDNTVIPAIDLIIKLCERHGVTVFASDLDSVRHGAVLGFGVHETSFGVDAATCAYKILHEGLTTGQVPIKLTDDFRFAVNQKKLALQGIELDSKLGHLIKIVEFIKDKQE